MAMKGVPSSPQAPHIQAGSCPAPAHKGSNPQSLAQPHGHPPAYVLGWTQAIDG